MEKYLLILIGLFICHPLSAQREILEKYPSGQDFYVGGINGIQKEIVKIIKEQKLQPCADKTENYEIPVLVNEDATINFIKDFDSLTIEKNKCAFDFSRKIIPHLKKWLPAKENGKKIAAIARIKIQPFFMYHSKDNPINNVSINPTYKKGLQLFSEEISAIFMQRIKMNENKISSLTFVVNENGEMEDFRLEGAYTENQKSDLIRSLSRIKGKWNPATFNGIPHKSKVRQPIRQEFDIERGFGPIQNLGSDLKHSFK